MLIVLKQCGDDFSRENIMKQASNVKPVALPLLLPGITVDTGPADFYPVQSMRLARFKGASWDLFGDVLHAESA